MGPIKKILILLLVVTSFLSCRSQSKVDAILLKKVDSLNADDINILIKNGYIRNADGPIIGTYLVSVANHHNTANWTIKQLLDTVKSEMKKMDNATAAKNNYGKDSVFIRDPRGNNMFIGMGQLSFDKLVARASLNLPGNYNGDYDLKINSTGAITTVSQLVSKSKYPVITGNVILFKRDNGELKNMKIGDIFEIANRVASSKEFAPFLDAMK
jgi:hypothetical protein